MSMLFIAGFDQCTNVTTDWDGIGAPGSGSNDLSGNFSRTGVGCYISNSPFGPFKGTGNKTSLIAGVAVKCSGVPAGQVFVFFSGGVSGVDQIEVTINDDGSLSLTTFGATFGTTVPGLIFTGVYAYVELQSTCNSITGSATLRVNGATVLSVSNINTNRAGTGFFDTVQLRGPGGGLTSTFDDFYLFDTSGAANNSLAGAVKVYTVYPVSDNTPLQWTPSTGTTHFNLVNGVPAESQTTYVSDATVGNTDQYLYNLNPVPSSVSILGVQHGLNSFLDAAGSGSIGSSCGGIVAGSVALSTSGHQYSFPRDTDPVISGPWTLANLINRQFGPNRTA